MEPIIDRVRSLELELHSYCPKRCTFCVNKLLDRDRDAEQMPDDMMDALLDDIVRLPNLRRMAFHRYNEPFINRRQTERINALIARLRAHTRLIEFWAASNLAFLSERNNYLRDCNLHFFSTRRYDVADPDLSAIFALVDIDSMASVSPTESILFLKDGKVVLFNDVTNGFTGELYDRGGSIPELSVAERTAPCNDRTINIGIDFNGNVMPCSNTQSQVGSHRPYILGNLGDKTLLEILAGDCATEFFAATARCDFPSICRRCQSKSVLRRFPARRPWCTCGRSKTAPYCDESHVGTTSRPWVDPAEARR